jgi:hypothetical protein
VIRPLNRTGSASSANYESRHLSVLTNIAANAIVPAPDLPTVLTAAKATAAVSPFLA